VTLALYRGLCQRYRSMEFGKMEAPQCQKPRRALIDDLARCTAVCRSQRCSTWNVVVGSCARTKSNLLGHRRRMASRCLSRCALRGRSLGQLKRAPSMRLAVQYALCMGRIVL